MKDRIRVFLLDDHEVLREGLKRLLQDQEDFEVVGEAATAAEALTQVPQLLPTVAVLDVRLPDGTGIEVCRAIRAEHPTVLALMLSAFPGEEAVLQAVLAGASGYLLKGTRAEGIIDAVRRVASGESLLDPQATDAALQRLRDKERQPAMLPLSRQEERVLDLIVEGLTNRQIAERLFLAEKTVKNYVSNVLAKLHMTTRSQAAAYGARKQAEDRV